MVIFLAAVFLLKLAVMLQLRDHILTQPDAGLDTTAYVALADRVLSGDIALGPELYFLSPLYIYFLASILAVARSVVVVRLVQIVLGTGAVALVYVAADEWFGRRAAWLAAALSALTGLFTFYEVLLLQAALDPFLTAAAMACLALGLTRGSIRWCGLAGVVYGVHACNRPNVALAAASIVLLLFAARRWRLAAAVTLGVALALAPVTLRNIASSGYWSPVASSHGGLNFYIGNNAEADGTYRSVPGITPSISGQKEDARRFVREATGRSLDDAGVSRYFYDLGWTWIREHPRAAARLFARKLSLTFSAEYIWLNYSYPFFSRDARTLLRVLFVGPWILVPLGLVGLVLAAPRAQRVDYAIWASFVPLYGLAVAVFYVADRYQLPLLVPLAVGAGAALDRFFVVLSARRWTTAVAASCAFALVFAWANRPLHIDNGVAEERTRMAERLVTLGRYGEAEQWAERAAALHRRPGVVHFRLAQQMLVHDRSAAAIAHFEEALRLDPGQPTVEFALGETYLDAERAWESVPHLRRALEAGVRADQAGYDLVRALGAIGDRAEAIRILKSVRPLREGDAERWVDLADLGIQLQEPRLAEMFSRSAITARPHLARAHGRLGVALNLEHRWVEAVRELEEAVRLDPTDATAHIGLAVAEANTGRIADARREVQEALRLDPNSASARRLRETLK